jgi:hypothetical protein
MKKLTFAVLASITLLAVAPAQGDKHAPGHMMSKMGAMTCCMQNLTAAEQKSAAAMIMKWNKGEAAAWDKRCNLCMADPHTALMKMDHSKITPQMVHMHMVSGLSKSEQKSMDMILADKKHSAVIMKMAENCCTYGATHAVHKGK